MVANAAVAVPALEAFLPPERVFSFTFCWASLRDAGDCRTCRASCREVLRVDCAAWVWVAAIDERVAALAPVEVVEAERWSLETTITWPV